MTILCMRCKPRGPGVPRKGDRGGPSRVVETRRAHARTRVLDGIRHNTITLLRIRECLKCRWRWKTCEVALPINTKRKSKK